VHVLKKKNSYIACVIVSNNSLYKHIPEGMMISRTVWVVVEEPNQTDSLVVHPIQNPATLLHNCASLGNNNDWNLPKDTHEYSLVMCEVCMGSYWMDMTK